MSDVTVILVSSAEALCSLGGVVTTQYYEGPMDNTVCDFWRMIWEQHLELILMLTNLEEYSKTKCAKYWPDDSEGEKFFGDFTVAHVEEKRYSDYIIRELKLCRACRNGKEMEQRRIVQYHFLVWKDFMAPEHPAGILKFIKRVNEAYSLEKGPILVHCSGCVRTLDSSLAFVEWVLMRPDVLISCRAWVVILAWCYTVKLHSWNKWDHLFNLDLLIFIDPDQTTAVHFHDQFSIKEALQREQLLENKLATLQRLVETTRQASDLGWKSLIDEDRLLSRVEVLENQLQIYSKNFAEDKLREELRKLQEDKCQYQGSAKESLRKVLQEKLEAIQKLQDIERTLSNTEDECARLKELCERSQQDLQDLAHKYCQQLQKVEELTSQLQETEDQHREVCEHLEQEKLELQARIQEQLEAERALQIRLEALQADGDLTQKQLVALQSHLHTLKSNDDDDDDVDTKLDMDNIKSTDSTGERVTVPISIVNMSPVDVQIPQGAVIANVYKPLLAYYSTTSLSSSPASWLMAVCGSTFTPITSTKVMVIVPKNSYLYSPQLLSATGDAPLLAWNSSPLSPGTQVDIILERIEPSSEDNMKDVLQNTHEEIEILQHQLNLSEEELKESHARVDELITQLEETRDHEDSSAETIQQLQEGLKSLELDLERGYLDTKITQSFLVRNFGVWLRSKQMTANKSLNDPNRKELKSNSKWEPFTSDEVKDYFAFYILMDQLDPKPNREGLTSPKATRGINHSAFVHRVDSHERGSSPESHPPKRVETSSHVDEKPRYPTRCLETCNGHVYNITLNKEKGKCAMWLQEGRRATWFQKRRDKQHGLTKGGERKNGASREEERLATGPLERRDERCGLCKRGETSDVASGEEERRTSDVASGEEERRAMWPLERRRDEEHGLRRRGRMSGGASGREGRQAIRPQEGREDKQCDLRRRRATWLKE
uniref:Tyrosine-protein phosphatase domain-containing protein n=1 Tax=Timema tahoe TaxID=61484 RepID=A0A7R9IM94_9NEOP|nr:unnamed protein product [Timema tahoe]